MLTFQLSKLFEGALNTVKVKVMKRVDTEGDMKDCFKATFQALPDENLLLAVILPFIVPDTTMKYACREAADYISSLVPPNFKKQEDPQIHLRLNSIFTTIFYHVQCLAVPSKILKGPANQYDFGFCPLAVSPIAIPTALYLGQKASVSCHFSEKIMIDASEFLNAIYDDMSQINEILTLKDQTLMIEGTVLFYKGFNVVNTLQECYLRQVVRVMNLYDLLERSDYSQEEVIIEYFYLRPQKD
mmetsp:Transcript_18743/g.17873  ORF Transcript_18743/g.17873 Transcript_18743/m.17873 type:complete len:243 (-) Transcript_18743:1528-2256(-)